MSHAQESALMTVWLASNFFLGLEWDWVVKLWTDKWEDFIVTTLGTMLGFALSYWLYLIQTNTATLAEKAKAKENAEKERLSVLQGHADHIRWLSGILEEVIRYSNLQADQLDNFVRRILDDPSTIHQLALVISFSTERLTKPDNKATFHAYNAIFSKDPNRDKSYRKLLSVSDYLTATISHIKETFKRYLDSLYGQQLRLKEMIQESFNALSTLAMSMEPEGVNNKLANSDIRRTVNDMLIHYNTKLLPRGASLREIMNECITPLKKPLLAHRHAQGVNELLTLLKNSSVLFSDIEFESSSFISAFSSSALRNPTAELSTMRASLDEAIEHYEASIRAAPSSQRSLKDL